MHFQFFQQKKMNCFRNIEESPTFFAQILKPTPYSDSSWKTASESVGIKTILTAFIGPTRALCNVLVMYSIWKSRAGGQNS